VESKTYYLYLWQNCFWDSAENRKVSKVCFGITSNLDRRRNGYEGHVGHDVNWAAAWSGPERLIRQLETKIKSDFAEYIWSGYQGFRYEWLVEEITMDQMVGWVTHETENIPTVSRVI
jgi:hypothetical protein